LEFWHEKWYIIPRSLNGSDSKPNLKSKTSEFLLHRIQFKLHKMNRKNLLSSLALRMQGLLHGFFSLPGIKIPSEHLAAKPILVRVSSKSGSSVRNRNI
jgi:hypothetical protein